MQYLTLLSALWILYILPCWAHRILLLPGQRQSHINLFTKLGEALTRRPHEVHMVISPTYQQLEPVKRAKIKVVNYDQLGEPRTLERDKFFRRYLWYSINKPKDIEGILETFEDELELQCEDILSDAKLLETLKAAKYDLAVVDGYFIDRCLYLIPSHMSVPYVTLTSHYEPWLARIPALPSFVPFFWSGYTEKMTLFERLRNTAEHIEWVVSSPEEEILPDKDLKLYPEAQKVSLEDLATKSLLHLITTDVAIDYPKPLMPNVIPIGGLTTAPPKQLPPSLKPFFDQSKNGVIVVSFGMMGTNLPEFVTKKLYEAFKKIKMNVLWKFGNPSKWSMPANIKVMDFIPQNDALAHPKTKLFVSHCSTHGQFEAVYNAVPMVCLAVYGDQIYNAQRMEYKGFGIDLPTVSFKPDELLDVINTVLNDPKYEERITKASRIMKDKKKTPGEISVYWIEHVIKYGGDHLRSYALEMPWYQYLMLDILLLVLTILFVVFFIFISIIKLLVRRCCKGKKKQKTS